MCFDRRLLVSVLQLGAAVGFVLVVPSVTVAQTCTQTLSAGANVAGTVSAAAAGATVCLNPGSFGSVTLNGIVKSPEVTIRTTSGQGASFSLSIGNGSNGIVLDSVTVTGGSITGGSTKNITIRNSTFTGPFTFNGLSNANVLLDRNTHNNINGGGQYSTPARLHLSYSGSTPSGVTIQNSLMDGGSADGVQTGVGVNIIGNEFRNIREGSCSDCHTDAIQLLGAADSVIRGNYIHDSATGIVAYDGLTRATIQDNIVDLGGRPWAIEVYADNGSVIRHNTLVYRSNCNYNQPCGTLTLDRKAADAAGRGTIVVDNIATSITTLNGSTYAQRDHNLVRSGPVSGDIAGSPIYLGGVLPTTLGGFKLAAGSPGAGAAANPAGSDIGATVAQSTSTPPLPATNVRVIR